MIVAFLCEYPSINGGENSLLSLVPYLVSRGLEPAVITPQHGPLADAFRSLGIEPIPFETTDANSTRIPLPELREKLAALIRGLRPDILHANSLAMSRLAGPVAASLEIRSIGHIRDIIRLNRTFINDVNRNTMILAVSRAVMDFHVEQGLDASRTRVLYNGIDLRKFKIAMPTGFLHRELGIPCENKLIAAVGQISLRKNQEMLLEAFAGIGIDGVSLLIVGERSSQKIESVEYENRLKSLAEKSPLRNRVFWLGVRRELEKLYPELSMLAHPAKQEPLGRVLLEASACGLPIVACDVGGTREIFPHGSGAALLVPADDTIAFRDAMRTLLDPDGPRNEMGNKARVRIEETFTAEGTAGTLLRQYESIMNAERIKK